MSDNELRCWNIFNYVLNNVTGKTRVADFT